MPESLPDNIKARVAEHKSGFTSRTSSSHFLNSPSEPYYALLEKMPSPAWLKDDKFRLVYLNEAFGKVFDIRRDTWLGKSAWDLLPEDQAQQIARNDQLAFDSSETISFVEPVTIKGTTFYFLSHKFSFLLPSGERYLGGVSIDITKQKSLELELTEKNALLEKLYVTDQLTQLYNRHKLVNVLTAELSRFERTCHEFGVILIDIDNFKKINDMHGNNVGDFVLQRFAGILREHTREMDCSGRWGDEEFMIICPETDTVGIKRLAEKLRDIVESYNFPPVAQLTASFGVAVSHKSDGKEDPIKRAYGALYKAKASKNKVAVNFQ